MQQLVVRLLLLLLVVTVVLLAPANFDFFEFVGEFLAAGWCPGDLRPEKPLEPAETPLPPPLLLWNAIFIFNEIKKLSFYRLLLRLTFFLASFGNFFGQPQEGKLFYLDPPPFEHNLGVSLKRERCDTRLVNYKSRLLPIQTSKVNKTFTTADYSSFFLSRGRNHISMEANLFTINLVCLIWQTPNNWSHQKGNAREKWVYRERKNERECNGERE